MATKSLGGTLTGQFAECRPLRVLELRCASGPGGGPEKTILFGTRQIDPARFPTIVCYIRREHDPDFDLDERAERLGVDFLSINERHSLDWRSLRELKGIIREHGIQIVHSHDYKSNLFALLLARQLGIIPLSTAHGYTGDSWRERWVYYPADRRLLTKFPRVIVVSTDLKHQLVKSGCAARRVKVILNGIDPQLFRRNHDAVPSARIGLGIATDDFVLGSVGRIAHQKRFDLLLQAFAGLLPQIPKLRLLVAGDGPLRGNMIALASKLQIGHRCSFIGHCSDVCRFYHALDLFVQSSEYEGTPNVVLEAMAMEVPIVATNAGGTFELLPNGNCGWIVPVRQPHALSDAIRQAVQQTAERRKRCECARKRVEHELSFEARTRKLERVYSALANQHRR